jgi:hypothetical protein
MKRKTKSRLQRKFGTSHEIHTKQIDKIMWVDFITHKNLENYSFEDIKDKLNIIKYHIGALHNVYRNESARNGFTDNRGGYETYGYKNLESIKSNLSYISDKYKCTFRLRWILDLLELEGV